MTIKLLPAARRDVRPIAAILSGWIDETEWMPRIHTHEDDRAHARLLLDETEVTVACKGRSVMGFMALRDTSIHSLYLAPDLRGQGIGRRFVDEAKTRHCCLDLWTFQANLRARRFYASQGFYATRLTNGEGNDEKLPDVQMVWTRGME